MNGGLNLIAQAMNWSAAQDRNFVFGQPLTATNLNTLYGAVGTSSTAAAATDTKLGAEVYRVLCTDAVVSGAVITWDFFFGQTQGNATLWEVGVFGQAGLLQPTLTSQITSGSTITSLPVTALASAIPANATVILGYNTSQQQVLTVTNAGAVQGATSIPISGSPSANATYAVGAVVGYLTGTLLDHTVLGSSIVKGSSQTMSMELDITLSSN